MSSLSHYNIDNVRQDKDGLACRLQEKEDKTKAWINEKNVEVYDAAGVRVKSGDASVINSLAPNKMYIINGKKFIIKK